jgi:hypothetical protein
VLVDRPDQNYTATSIYDLAPDGLIDFADLGVMTQSWLAAGPGDFDGDGIVNFADFAKFADKWLSGL